MAVKLLTFMYWSNPGKTKGTPLLFYKGRSFCYAIAIILQIVYNRLMNTKEKVVSYG